MVIGAVILPPAEFSITKEICWNLGFMMSVNSIGSIQTILLLMQKN